MSDGVTITIKPSPAQAFYTGMFQGIGFVTGIGLMLVFVQLLRDCGLVTP